MKIIHSLLWISLGFSTVQASPLPEQAIKSYLCTNCTRLSHDSLQDNWSLTPKSLNTKPRSNLRKSYGYKKTVSAAELQQGVQIKTQASGAVIRITSVHNKKIPALWIKSPKQALLPLKNASSLYQNQAPQAESDFNQDEQTISQLKPELGAGTFVLHSKVKTEDTYIISVLDKYSDTYLSVETDNLFYHYGDTVRAQINLEEEQGVYTKDEIDAYLVGPLGQRIAMDIRETNTNQFEALASLNSEANDQGDNWYLHVYAHSDLGLTPRSAYTVFSYSIPSATLTEVHAKTTDKISITTKAKVAVASRYALQSVLFYKDKSGNFIPLETAQKAQWLEPGTQAITFTFDNSKQVSEDRLYLGYLHLLDYGQMKSVYQYDSLMKLTQLSE